MEHKKFEYLISDPQGIDTTEEKWGFLNKLGDDGWELIVIQKDTRYIFKRAIINKPD